MSGQLIDIHVHTKLKSQASLRKCRTTDPPKLLNTTPAPNDSLNESLLSPMFPSATSLLFKTQRGATTSCPDHGCKYLRGWGTWGRLMQQTLTNACQSLQICEIEVQTPTIQNLGYYWWHISDPLLLITFALLCIPWKQQQPNSTEVPPLRFRFVKALKDATFWVHKVWQPGDGGTNFLSGYVVVCDTYQVTHLFTMYIYI